ncbi:MAG: transcriptional regulator PhoB-like protein [Proteobacteria bacterium SG_bin7]|nr:MAG: transcriptional regulator PhoB-like protein [Proteobacteria bacterium SG_bin7]
MSKKPVDTTDLVAKIEKITREKLTKAGVVSLDKYRELTRKETTHTILVIEDDETMRNALRRLFEAEGFKVLAAADGTQLSDILNEPIDLMMLDVGLPWINGFELAKLMKEHKDLKKIPLVFISGKTSEIDIKRGFQVGADDYIKKPFDIENVKKTVRTLLELKK